MEQKREDQSTPQRAKTADAPPTDPRTVQPLSDEDASTVAGGFNPQPDPPGVRRHSAD